MSYPFLQELPPDDATGGASGTQPYYVLAYGKKNSPDFPFNVVNEKVASDLARSVGLPVPEGILYQHRGEWMFFSRAVGTNEAGETPPPGTSQDVANAVANAPGIMESIVCCDLFVCNNDRKWDNLICDSEKRLWFYDFGNALFYRPSNAGRIEAGIPRLQSIEADLDALFDKPYAYLSECRTWEAVSQTCERIAALPDYMVENAVSLLPSTLLNLSERDFLIEFLNRRKGQMEAIIRSNAKLFPNLSIPISA